MRFAIATDDTETIAGHTGRCRGFAIFEALDGESTLIEHRDNTFTAHARGECAGDEHEHHAGHPSHAALLDAIGDCSMLIARGMGPRLVADLTSRGVEPVFCETTSVKDAAADFAAGRLTRSARGTCHR